MEPTWTDAKAHGIILWSEMAFDEHVERSLLMFDVKSWAKWIAGRKREQAAQCEREGRIRSMAESNDQIREIDRWLLTGRVLCKGTNVLYRRQMFGIPVVTSSNFDAYVRKVLPVQQISSRKPVLPTR